MSKKRGASAISDALTGNTSQQGWKNQFSEGTTEPSKEDVAKTDTFKRKTYLMTADLIERIEAQAEAHEVGINEMARYCFDLALSQMETGQHQPEVKEVMTRKRTLEV